MAAASIASRGQQHLPESGGDTAGRDASGEAPARCAMA